jgi:hypothetical protein
MQRFVDGWIRTEYVADDFPLRSEVIDFDTTVVVGTPQGNRELVMYVWPGTSTISGLTWLEALPNLVRHEGSHLALSLHDLHAHNPFDDAWWFGNNRCY